MLWASIKNAHCKFLECLLDCVFYLYFEYSHIDKRQTDVCKASQALHTLSVSEVQLKTNMTFLWLRKALRCKLVSKGD